MGPAVHGGVGPGPDRVVLARPGAQGWVCARAQGRVCASVTAAYISKHAGSRSRARSATPAALGRRLESRRPEPAAASQSRGSRSLSTAPTGWRRRGAAGAGPRDGRRSTRALSYAASVEQSVERVERAPESPLQGRAFTVLLPSVRLAPAKQRHSLQ